MIQFNRQSREDAMIAKARRNRRQEALINEYWLNRSPVRSALEIKL